MDALHFEVMFRAIRRSSTKQHGDCVTISLQIHPQEVPESLWDPEVLHQRFMVALAQIGDDEQPRGEKSFSYARQAGVACKIREFQEWLFDTYSATPYAYDYGYRDLHGNSIDKYEDRAAQTARLLRGTLDVASRKELDLVPEKQAEWTDLFNRYKEFRNET